MLYYVKWKWIPGFKGIYKISTRGKVKSVNRSISHWRGGIARIKGRVIKQGVDLDGYLVVCLSKNGKARPYGIHHLLLITFVGPCPQNMECRHLDGNRMNNSLENICWGTRKENAQDRIRHGTSKVNQAENHPMAFFTNDQVREIRRRWARGERGKALSLRFRADRFRIYLAATKRTYRSVED